MLSKILRYIKRGGRRKYEDINPEDIFLDAANLPGYAENRFEGRMEKPMGPTTFTLVKGVIVCLVVLMGYRLWSLEVRNGPLYAQISENNRLSHTVIFANRGVIYDRNGLELATNAIKEGGSDFAARVYTREYGGLSHVVGYVKYPLADSKGEYYEENYRGRDGAEVMYDELLSGENGLRLVETDAVGEVTSESIIEPPQDGKPLVLSVDARVSNVLHDALKDAVESRGFVGGAGVIMDVETGEILALTSMPEYDQNMLTEGSDAETIRSLFVDASKPFLNRAVGGVYSPGSIIKPILALGALEEGIISPSKSILSTGSITVPNPYDPTKPSIFRDWDEHGWTDMRQALAVSSDVYFYSIGGGYGDQKGLGIERIDKYLSLFGIGEKTGINLLGEVKGNIPTPEWKRETFDGDIWRLGDTYITSIGQYGTLVTPVEAVRFVAAIANGGKLLVPTVVRPADEGDVEVWREVEFDPEDWRVVKEGMRGAVTYGTAVGLNVPYVEVAAKTGTAEVGSAKRYVHSWSTGFFPFNNPRYAFVLLLERGPSTNTLGATSVMRQVIDWMSIYAPEYLSAR